MSRVKFVLSRVFVLVDWPEFQFQRSILSYKRNTLITVLIVGMHQKQYWFILRLGLQ